VLITEDAVDIEEVRAEADAVLELGLPSSRISVSSKSRSRTISTSSRRRTLLLATSRLRLGRVFSSRLPRIRMSRSFSDRTLFRRAI
jgi:UV DNA damage repair endonuclease